MKVYYYLFGDITYGSSRLRVYYLEDWFREHGVDISWNYKESFKALDGDIIVFQKMKMPEVARKAREKGIKVIYDMSDRVSSSREMINLADYLTTSTKELLEYMFSQAEIEKKGKVVREVIDYIKRPIPQRKHTKSDNLSIIYATAPVWLDNLKLCFKSLMRLKNDVNYKFFYLSGDKLPFRLWEKRLDAKHIPWSLETCSSSLRNADVAIAPQTLYWKYETKVVTPISHNIPVVSSKTPPYYRFAKATNTEEFCCGSEDEWYRALLKMFNPDIRNDFLKKTLPYLWKNYNINTLGKEWLSIFKEVLE